jgi:hypothetical protein
VDLRAGLDDVGKRKFLTLPGFQPVASRYTKAFPEFFKLFRLGISENVLFLLTISSSHFNWLYVSPTRKQHCSRIKSMCNALLHVMKNLSVSVVR